MNHVQLEPDLVLPIQFRRASIASAEKRLLLAVLEEAVATYQRHLAEGDRKGLTTFADAEAWFASEDGSRLYSFVGICDALGLDPTYVRSGLTLWADRQRRRSPETPSPPYRLPFPRVNGKRNRTQVPRRRSRHGPATDADGPRGHVHLRA
jgi:hypothetical protein